MTVSTTMAGHEIGEFEMEQLPAMNVRTGSKVGVIFLLLVLMFTSMFTFFFVRILAGALLGSEYQPVLLGLLTATLIGIMPFRLALKEFLTREETTISQRNVAVRSRGMLGWMSWLEPLDRYEGVLLQKKSSRTRNSPTRYIVELHHSETKKIVLLYASMSDSGLRAKAEYYCKRLNMPLLESDDDSLVRRNVDDLDKSVRELAAEGKLTSEFDPSEPPPAGLSTHIDGDTFVVIVERNFRSVKIRFIGLLFGGVCLASAFFVEEGSFGLGFFGLLITVVFAFSGHFKPEIRINKDVVHLRYLGPWGPTSGQQIRVADVESVTIASHDGQKGFEGLVLTSNTGELRIGDGLSKDVLEWVKKCILAIIT